MDETVHRAAKEMQESGSSADDLVVFLHASGCTVIESIKALKDLLGVSLSDAKQMVACQACWKHESAAADALHSELLNEMETRSACLDLQAPPGAESIFGSLDERRRK